MPTLITPATHSAPPKFPVSEEHLSELRATFDADFSLVDGETGDVISNHHGRCGGNWSAWGEMCRRIAETGRSGILCDEEPLSVWGVPLPEYDGRRAVAVGFFLSRPLADIHELRAAAQALSVDPRGLGCWAAEQTTHWPPRALERMTALLERNWKARNAETTAKSQINQLAGNLADTYEELSLLYRLTQSLKISQSSEALGRLALQWTIDAIHAESMALLFFPDEDGPVAHGEDQSCGAHADMLYVVEGPCPFDSNAFLDWTASLGVSASSPPLVQNPPVTTAESWPFPNIRQVILLPLNDGPKQYGLLAAFNHTEDKEFGSTEAKLLGSVADILGIHGGNAKLFRQQSELLTGMVRALTSAIDAKDNYTCGHSDRVARVAVRLGRELGCTRDQLRWLYLSGLLHDIGKIGIDQQVLHKPGRLTDKEFEHIQTHPRIGHNILRGIKQLDQVLPVVLHHHEAWNGSGYPSQLAGEAIPLLARIAAVADSYDAMASTRPYRQGMPDDKIDVIFREGSGIQWDAAVIDAFFRVRSDIRQISDERRDTIKLDDSQWS